MSSPRDLLRVWAPAKVNLSLRVLGRRADGYHSLESLMVPVSLCDGIDLRVVPRSRGQAAVVCRVRGREKVPGGAANLATRAARRVLEACGSPLRVEIELYKRIPVGAGLGGGSSDAGAVLYAMGRLPRLRVSRVRLTELALELGADVPFALCSRPALATGIGERLGFVERFPALPMVIVVPPARVSTAWAYGNALKSLTSGPKGTTDPVFLLRRRRFAELLRNDFQTGVAAALPDVGRLVGRLGAAGARAVVMSGTGSAVVGVFGSAREAAAAASGFDAPDTAFAVKALRRRPALGS